MEHDVNKQGSIIGRPSSYSDEIAAEICDIVSFAMP
jgi:hypothetical protein